MEKYTLNEIAEMTGFTTRKLRYDLKLGILEGEKENGTWTFTPEEFTDYISHPNIKPSLQSKRQGVVYDFLADTEKEGSRLCLILDDRENVELEALMALVNRLQEEDPSLQFRYQMDAARHRMILTAHPEQGAEFLKEYLRT